MAPVSPLCSRNARPQKALVGRAQWGAHPSYPWENVYEQAWRGHIFHSRRPCWTAILSILSYCGSSGIP
jgi:hypothetical protein